MKKEGKRKRLSLLVCVSMLSIALVGGTLAYLTVDAGAESNVFSVGSLDVSLNEEVGVIGEGGEVKDVEGGAEYSGIMPGDFLQKEVSVANDGETDAYVAITVTVNNADKINRAIDVFYEGAGYGSARIQAVYDEIFAGWGINYDPRPGADGNDSRGVIDGTYGLPEHVMQVDFSKTTDFDNDTTMIGIGNWFMSEKEAEIVAGGGRSGYLPGGGYYTSKLKDDSSTVGADERDYTIVYTYYAYLPAGESTTIFEGLNVPAGFTADQLAMFDGLEINVSASAIQADNIPVASKYVGDENGEAKTAFELLAGQMDAPEGVAIDAVASSTEELDAALNAGATAIYLNAGEYNVPNSAQNKDGLTIVGDTNAVLKVMNEGEGGCDYGFSGSTVTFNGVTIDTSSNTGWEMGYARANGTYVNCVIKGQYSLYGNSVFNNCTLNVSGDAYNIRTWGAPKASFVNCTFNSDGKAMLLYGTADTHLSIENCVFNDNGGLTDLKAAIEIGNDYNKSYSLAVNNTVVNGYEINDKGINTGTTLWANKNGMDKDHLNVVVDGVDVY